MIHDLLLLNDVLSVCLPPAWAQQLRPLHSTIHITPQPRSRPGVSPPAPQPCLNLDQQSLKGVLASGEELGVESPELAPPTLLLRDTGLGKGPTVCYRWGLG